MYALEVIRAERARLNLNGRLSTVLDTLADQASGRPDLFNPVFLLSVDDFDINPAMCLPLLRLIRMISVPRLFVLVLGDIDMATVVLNLKVSGDLALVAQGANDETGLLSMPGDEVANIAGEVAFNALRKLIPPAQRVHLLPLKVRESLNFRPFEHIKDDPIHVLLSKLRLHVPYFKQSPQGSGGKAQDDNPPQVAGQPVQNLRDFLLIQRPSVLPDEPPPDRVKDDKLIRDEFVDRCVYVAKDFLEAPVRRITDLWLGLVEASEQERFEFDSSDYKSGPTSNETAAEANNNRRSDQETTASRVISYFARNCQRSLEEDRAMAVVGRSTLPLAVGKGAGSEVEFGLLPLELKASTGTAKRVTSVLFELDKVEDSKQPPIEIWGQLKVTPQRTWRFTVASRRKDRKDTQNSSDDSWHRTLSHEAASALMLHHDLMVLAAGQPEAGESELSPGYHSDEDEGGFERIQPWAVVEWRQGTLVRPVSVQWPLPAWRSFWEHDLFLATWNQVLGKLPPTSMREKNPKLTGWLAFAWISAATAILSGEQPAPMREAGDRWLHLNYTNAGWEELTKQLNTLASIEKTKEPLREQRIRDWVVRLAEMMLPECGMPKDVAGLLERATKVKQLWKQEQLMIQDRHDRQMTRMAKLPRVKTWLEIETQSVMKYIVE